MEDKTLVKVQFFDQDVGYENLWAEAIGENLYEIKSIPYFVYDISVGDVVRAKPNAGQVLAFIEVVQQSSHKTIRVRPKNFTLDDEQGRSLQGQLEILGGVIETLPPRLIAVDIPPEVPLEPIEEFLRKSSIPWERANPS